MVLLYTPETVSAVGAGLTGSSLLLEDATIAEGECPTLLIECAIWSASVNLRENVLGGPTLLTECSRWFNPVCTSLSGIAGSLLY